MAPPAVILCRGLQVRYTLSLGGAEILASRMAQKFGVLVTAAGSAGANINFGNSA